MIIFVIAVLLFLGLFVLSALLGHKASELGSWEKIALALLLGLGTLTIIMFLLGKAGISLNLFNILLAASALALVLAVYLLRIKSFCVTIAEFKVKTLTAVDWLLVSLIALKTVFVFFSALIKPVVDIDAFQQYAIVAKGVFYDGSFTLPYLQQFIGDKPLLPFLAQGWALLGLGSVNDSLIKVFSPTLFLCLLVIFYAALKRYYSRTQSLLFTFLASTFPFIVYHATTAYADVPITVYYGAATIYLYLFMKELHQGNRSKADTLLLIALSLLGIAVWAKKAALVLAGINLVMLAIFLFFNRIQLDRTTWRSIAGALLIFLLFAGPWLVLGQFGSIAAVVTGLFHSQATSAGAATAAAAEQTGNKAEMIVSIFSRKLFLYADWHLLWALVICSMVFFYRRVFSQPLVYLLAIIGLGLLSLFVQFGSGETFRWLLDGTLFDRLAMNSVPAALFFCAEAILPGLQISVFSRQ